MGGGTQLRLKDGANDDRRCDQASTKLGKDPKWERKINLIISKSELCTEVDLKSIRLIA